MILTIAAQQILGLRRQRVFVAVLAAMLLISALAGVLGWSSQRTIVKVFDQAVTLLSASGRPAPPNPFLLKPKLSLLSNMVVYVPLIGALLALIIGHLSIVDDEANGLGRLLFSRQVTRSQYAVGKILSSAIVLAVVLVASWLLSVCCLLLVNKSLTAGELGRLSLFYGLSWLYLLVFALIGMITVLVTRRRSLALLSAMGIWLVLTFAVPQFTSGLRPTQSLNPIIEPVGTSQKLFQLTTRAQPFSPVEQYKAAAGQILDTARFSTIGHEPTGVTLARVLPILGLVVLLAFATLRVIKIHDFSRSASND